MKPSYTTYIGTANPVNKIENEAALEMAIKSHKADNNLKRKLGILYKQTSISTRYTVLHELQKDTAWNIGNDTKESGTGMRMQRYESEALPLAMKAIEDANIPKEKLDKVTHLITFSCTGMYAPGLDIELIHAIDLPSNAERYNINFMGCYAGITALKLADQLVKANDSACVLAVGVELCSLHFQNDASDDFLMSNALFGDGAAAFFVESEAACQACIENTTFFCDIIPSEKRDMAWHVRDFGFEMRLSSYVPELINGHMEQSLNSLRIRLNGAMDVKYYALHPGGRRILEYLQKSLSLQNEELNSSYEVLNDYGNMSSVTVWFVLKNLLAKNLDNNAQILSLAFGPGLTIESAILTVKHV